MSERISINIENHVADVRLNRADKMNALDRPMFEAIIEAQSVLAANTSVRAVVLSGEGRAFCAGLDLSALDAGDGEAPGSGSRLTDRTHGNANLFQAVAIGWRQLPVPVIAAVHGVCFGGGLQIASGADIRILAPDARLAVMEMKWGLVPDMAGFALWRGYVRDDVLRELTYTNREFSGEDAQSLGFATYVDDQPLRRAQEIATQIASKHPQAIREAKILCNTVPDLDESAILMAESVSQEKVIRTPDQIEAVMAQMEKRAPAFSE
ncbi:MAG: crotonase/enoyl-CoA hydratase family protein [Halioglobus sp.]|nr:crotonase/enoyl-CoA hydratase family protein [Halioglobus sp.]